MNEELHKVLENFCRLEGVQSALLLAADGGLVGSHDERSAIPLQDVQALASQCLSLGAAVGGQMARDRVTHSYVELGDFSVVAEVLDSRAALVIVTDPETNLGRLRLEIRKNRKIIEGMPL